MQHISPSQMNQLLALARDNSGTGRRHLVSEISSHFLPDHVRLSDREIELLHAIVDELIRSGDTTVKRDLAECAAISAKISRHTLLMLVADRIDVAEPVLSKSKKLSDDDLVRVIAEHGRDHAKAIATRESISAAVVDALVITGDVDVMTMVAKNLGAVISDDAMRIMTEAARFAEQLRGPISARPELKPEQATQIYWWLSGDMRRSLLKRFGLNPHQSEQALQNTIEELLAHHQLAKTDDAAMNQVADWLLEREAVNPKSLTQVLRLGFFRLFNILMARITALPQNAVDTVVLESGGRSLAALCKALGADKPCFVSIFLLSRGSRPGEQIVHPRELSMAIAAFDRVTPTIAQQLLQTWRRDPSYLLRSQDTLTDVETAAR